MYSKSGHSSEQATVGGGFSLHNRAAGHNMVIGVGGGGAARAGCYMIRLCCCFNDFGGRQAGSPVGPGGELLVQLYKIEKAGGEVAFLWVPAHVGVKGNEMADGAAKRALRREVDMKVAIGVNEYRSIIRRRITAEWQEQWERKKRGEITLVFRTMLKRGRTTWGQRGGIR